MLEMLKRPVNPCGRGIIPLCEDAVQDYPPGIIRVNVFCLRISNRLDLTRLECQALVLAPSIELAKEIKKFMIITGATNRIKVQAFDDAEEAASVNISMNHAVVGTPGKVLDLLRSKSLDPRKITMYVLDYADQMLSLGLQDQIYDVFKMLPSDLYLGVFTESITPEVHDFTRKLMNNPPEPDQPSNS